MLSNLTVIIPFWRGQAHIQRLLDSLPAELPVFIAVDYDSPLPVLTPRAQTTVYPLTQRGYFSGACNVGFAQTTTDVLIMNQDAWFKNDHWQAWLTTTRATYGIAGDGVFGHPAWPNGYVQGTCMFIRRDVLDTVGEFDAQLYPLWGATAEFQVRACRAGFTALPVNHPAWLGHEERKGKRFGSAITTALEEAPHARRQFIRTPPEISVIIPCYNYGRFLPDAIASFIGGPSCLGELPAQTFTSYEIIIVDDGSTDDSRKIATKLANAWQGIRLVTQKNKGLPTALNTGIAASYGKFVNIMSADDMAMPRRLEFLYQTAVANPHTVAFGDLRYLDDTTPGKVVTLEYKPEKLLERNCMSADILYPRQAWEEVGGYQKLMQTGREDWAFNVGLLANGYPGVHCGHIIGWYRQHVLSRHKRNTTPAWRALFAKHIRQLYPQLYSPDSAVAAPNAILLRYTGGATAREPFPTQSGTVYHASRKRALIAALTGDVPELLNTNLFVKV